MPQPYDKRANMIDGLPSTFNVLFVLRTGKKCELCTKYIKKDEITKKLVLYTDEFEFVHKPCLEKKGIIYEHLRKEDLSAPVKLMLRTGKSYKAKSKKNQLEQSEVEHPQPNEDIT